MARRKSKKTRTRRSKNINLGGLAESALIANAVTSGFFNCTLNDFIFAKDGASGGMGQTAITGREIIAGVTGGIGGYGTSRTVKAGGGTTGVRPYTTTIGNTFGVQVRENLSENGGAMIASLILIPAGFKVFNRLTSKPRGTLNKALKMSGLPVKV
tara:strand:+ start:115 stop:582 length:468 start_codon:yes stop_codon:yes gene_type:complete